MKKRRRMWSEVEVEYLRERYATTPISELCRKLDRPRQSVRICAAREGLSSTARAYRYAIGEFSLLSEGADGARYLHQKISSSGVYHRDWQPYHRLVWERANGKIPAGYFVTFKPGRRSVDPQAITLDALQLSTRAQMARWASKFNRLPPELAQVAALRRKVYMACYRRERAKQD